MLIVLIVIFIALAVLFFSLSDDWYNEGFTILSTISTAASIVLFITMFFFIGSVANGSVYDDKIKLYEEENAKIEAQVEATVMSYLEYEKETLTELKGESAMAVVSLYPELKADTLITKQIEIFNENNKKIKELREEKLDLKMYKWWLYFG